LIGLEGLAFNDGTPFADEVTLKVSAASAPSLSTRASASGSN
jgi:hypothetical protein